MKKEAINQRGQKTTNFKFGVQTLLLKICHGIFSYFNNKKTLVQFYPHL